MRQAVVIIHGIGEQSPMDTLRGFVKGVIGHSQSSNLPFFSKPDHISNSLELRRIAVDKTLFKGNSTDFYELYWQHLMTGTTVAHVKAWQELLLWRNPNKIPKRLRPYWYIAWGLVAVVAMVATNGAISSSDKLIPGVWGVLLFYLVRMLLKPLLQSFLLRWIGDAARYLSPFPENVGIRHAIRSAGLDLLRGLHLDPLRRYDRIIVVGHSLGSVIAYDVLTYLWQEMHSKVEQRQIDGKLVLAKLDYSNKDNPTPSSVNQPELDALLEMGNTILRDNTCKELSKEERSKWSSEYMERQKNLLQEYSNAYNAGGEDPVSRFPWRITDLVTLGSPLTYAEFLLADDSYPFCEKVSQREFPTCPPQSEDPRDDDNPGDGERGLLQRVLTTGSQRQGIHILHHAALFACTRWTNLYFPGDIIAGPLAPYFGCGIKDIELKGHSANKWTSHVKYWAEREILALKELRYILCNSGDSGESLSSGEVIS